MPVTGQRRLHNEELEALRTDGGAIYNGSGLWLYGRWCYHTSNNGDVTMKYTTLDILEFRAMIYYSVTQGLTFDASTVDGVHTIIYTGGY